MSKKNYDFIDNGIHYKFANGKTGSELIVAPGKYKGAKQIPATVTHLGKIYLVTKIEERAFGNCTMLTSVKIPSSITTIGECAFEGCCELKSIKVDLANPTYKDDNERALLTKDGTTIIAYANHSGTSYIIPNSVTKIEKKSFLGCKSLKSIDIPSSVTKIKNGAFECCKSIVSIKVDITNSNYKDDNERALLTKDGTTIIAYANHSGTLYTIPFSVTSIERKTFYSCKELKTVVLLNPTPPALDQSAFNDKTILLYVPIGTSATYAKTKGWKNFLKTIELDYDFEADGVFYKYTNGKIGSELTVSRCELRKKGVIDIPATITHSGRVYHVSKIEGWAFYECRELTAINIPSSVTAIGDGAFKCCTGLESITIPNSVTTIRESAFYECSGVTSISIPSTIIDIDTTAFAKCKSLATIKVDISNPFYKDDNGRALLTKDGTTIITYANQSSNTYVIPSSVISIGNYAFHNCTNLTSIVIPSSVIWIGNYTFYNCTNLTSIVIPSSVTSIGNHAFLGCNELQSVFSMNTTPSTLDITTFDKYKIPLYVPAGSKEAYTSAKGWNKFAKIITMDYDFEVDGIYYKFANDKTKSDVRITNCIGNKYRDAVCIPTKVTYSGKEFVVSSIDNFAFNKCRDLTTIRIPESITEIGNKAFCSCDSLTSIKIPSSVVHIGESVFWGCI